MVNTCVICRIPQLELTDVETARHGNVGVCEGCIKALVDEELDRIEEAQEKFCAGCPNYTGSGCKYPGVTSGACA